MYELIPRSEIPAPSTGRIPAHRDALELALAHPDQAVPVLGVTQKEKSRLVQVCSSSPSNSKGKYAGRINTTVVRHGVENYDVYLTAIPVAPEHAVPSHGI